MKTFVPDHFEVPTLFEANGWRLEPLTVDHNEGDYAAWSSSTIHIRNTPGFERRGWPYPMTLAENKRDLTEHMTDFETRRGFTYAILDRKDNVLGAVYIYPSDNPEYDVSVRSWVRADHDYMDRTVWRTVTRWIEQAWPFERIEYAPRD